MTREEAKRRMEICRDFLANNFSDMGEPNFTAFNMAIQALSQEPCDDAISRDAVLKLMDEYNAASVRQFGRPITGIASMRTDVRDLPSVTQKSETVTEFADRCRECGARYGKLLEQKSGKWIMSDDGLYRPICDKCGAHPWKGYIPTVEEATEVFKYCPNCGAKMETETWNGIHGQITAPKGTFEKIWEDAESEE